MPTRRTRSGGAPACARCKLDQVAPFGASARRRRRACAAAARRACAHGVSEEGRAGLLVQHNSGTGLLSRSSDDAGGAGRHPAGPGQAVREHPDLVRRYFMTEAVPAEHDKFSALHGAFWSGGHLPLRAAQRRDRDAVPGARLRRRRRAGHLRPHADRRRGSTPTVFIDEFISPTAESGQGLRRRRDRAVHRPRARTCATSACRTGVATSGPLQHAAADRPARQHDQLADDPARLEADQEHRREFAARPGCDERDARHLLRRRHAALRPAHASRTTSSRTRRATCSSRGRCATGRGRSSPG